jgi:pimeloyl-ACP methyl ester carboxylesterase
MARYAIAARLVWVARWRTAAAMVGGDCGGSGGERLVAVLGGVGGALALGSVDLVAVSPIPQASARWARPVERSLDTIEGVSAIARVFDWSGSAGGEFICVSGLGGVVDEWDRVARGLRRRGIVVALALPIPRSHSGRRAESPLDAGRRLVRSALPPEGPSRPVLIGHSMGAIAAMLVAADEPDRVAGLVLTAPFLPVARNGRSTVATVADYARHRALFIAETAGRKRPRRQSLSLRSRAASLGALAGYGLRPSAFHARADHVTCPVLVVHGSSDHYVPPSFASGAAERHFNWQLRLIDGAGHFPHCDAPESWLQAVEPWLDRVAVAT